MRSLWCIFRSATAMRHKMLVISSARRPCSWQARSAAEGDPRHTAEAVSHTCAEGEAGAGADASSEGVQRDLLPIIEGSVVSTKYGNVATDHILFICSGAFHSCKPSDMLAELQGRLPIRVELKGLTCAPAAALPPLPLCHAWPCLSASAALHRRPEPGPNM